MSIPKKYDPSQVEDKWYQHWQEHGFFSASVDPDKEPYSIVIPPPNVTGVLHMGHMLNNTIQDILIRKARMEGKAACWVPGTDHASIATEAKVVRMLREKGIKKSDLSREEFLKYAWEWTEKYGGIILEQLKKLGASCDWNRTAFTMEESYYKAVIRVFVDLYRKGFIYRGLRMINWDVEAMTAVSNEEVIYQENGESSTLYSVRYAIKDSDQHLVIATQRPETIMGDTGVAVNPRDERYKHLIGQTALVPFINREIPIIADDYVELDFGTGCLKVTPAHDPNDYEIGLRHQLEIIDTINLDGTLNEKCEIPAYTGKDRFEVRDMIVSDLRKADLLVSEEEFITRIGRSERTNSVVEPKLSLQWFIKMKEISREAHRAVMEDDIRLYPEKFKSTYNHWMENVRDWCISRQLWWGHRIPAYYYGEGDEDFVVAETPDKALEEARKALGDPNFAMEKLRQDEDVLDTWASSWLFPLAVYDGFNDKYFDLENGKIKPGQNKDLDYFYPTNTLVTAPEILFFWVARMIISGYEYTGKPPFRHVYLTGIVRDKQRRKMSKSLGNSPEPLDLISEYGADGVRTGMLFSSPAGNDLLFDEKLVEQGRNFTNKIWNAFRLVKGWQVEDKDPPTTNQMATTWFRSNFNQALITLEDHFSKFRISDALISVYKMIWDDFCSWYLEWIKPPYGESLDKVTMEQTLDIFEDLIRVLHPFMPFITEELWHNLRKRSPQDCLIVQSWPTPGEVDQSVLKQIRDVFETTSNIRNIRNTKHIPIKEKVTLMINDKEDTWKPVSDSLVKLANLEDINYGPKPENAFNFMVGTTEFYLVANSTVDKETERHNLEKELSYLEGFLKSVEKKLENDRFVQNAPPHVVETEKKKREDARIKIKTIRESLSTL